MARFRCVLGRKQYKKATLPPNEVSSSQKSKSSVLPRSSAQKYLEKRSLRKSARNMIRSKSLAITLSIIMFGMIPYATAVCYKKCRFRFCNYHISFTTGRGTPDIAFSGAICAVDNTRIGIVGTTGEARLVNKEQLVRISQWHPEGLQKHFPMSFFKSFIIEPQGNISGIGHETVHANQKSYLNNRCFVIPLLQYVVLNKFNTPIDNIYPSQDEPLTNCVAFKSYSY